VGCLIILFIGYLLKIAPAIVTSTYIALIGILAVAGALAFGLGGRELAADVMRDAYDSSREDLSRARRLRPDIDRVER
jgi:hypothetical protein